jgi:hypothetical protein
MTCISVIIKVAASNLRFGDGVTAEVGMDLKNMKARKVIDTPWRYTSSLIINLFRLGFSLILMSPN